jgi:hypothetical protein
MKPSTLEAAHRVRSTKASRRAEAKARHGWEEKPIACHNCSFYLAAYNGPDYKSHPPICNRGKFFTSTHSVCDEWDGRRGETADIVFVERMGRAISTAGKAMP